MICFHPITAWRGEFKENGKREIIFDKTKCKSIHPQQLTLPCGQCVGCRLERSRQWAMRCVHEASLFKENMFITLTYNNDHLPADGSLHVEHFQLFMKRLRRYFQNEGKKLRFFHCGEYGDTYGRPHYHACIFGVDFSDKVLWRDTAGIPLYSSDTLNDLWGLGYCIIGEVTYDSAAYVARYIMKKITGDKAEAYYSGKKPEYITMSRRPGIGRGWYEKYKGDVFPHDYTVVNGAKVKPPKFYLGLYEKEENSDYLKLKEERMRGIDYVYDYYLRLAGFPNDTMDNSTARLAVKEYCLKDRLKTKIKKRDLDGTI